ncbi:hypothetical protein NL676_038869 [Syzygium grande]|nr:hypothetical protein NL676_038869 [Syzygium grande]
MAAEPAVAGGAAGSLQVSASSGPGVTDAIFTCDVTKHVLHRDKDVLIDYSEQVMSLGSALMFELLSESLGLRPDRLPGDGLHGGPSRRCLRDLGTYSLPGDFLLFVIIGTMGRLLMMPVPLISSFQLMRNDRFKSMEHRVPANADLCLSISPTFNIRWDLELESVFAKEEKCECSAETKQMKTNRKYDRTCELKAFDESKAGVKGLADAGITEVPRIFVDCPENLRSVLASGDDSHFRIPIIDLEDIVKHPSRRKEVVNEVQSASETWDFFQVANHGIPAAVLEEMLDGVRRFHEQGAGEETILFTRFHEKRCVSQQF